MPIGKACGPLRARLSKGMRMSISGISGSSSSAQHSRVMAELAATRNAAAQAAAQTQAAAQKGTARTDTDGDRDGS